MNLLDNPASRGIESFSLILLISEPLDGPKREIWIYGNWRQRGLGVA